MASNINAKWKLITHTMSKTGEHKMLVGYRPGAGSHNSIFFLSPLYNLNDANMDGSVGIMESLFGANIYDPYSFFELFTAATKFCCTIDAADQLRDYELRGKTQSAILRATFKAAAKAFVAINIERLLSPGIELTLAKSKLAEMNKHSDKLLFLVQNRLETFVESKINGWQGLK